MPDHIDPVDAGRMEQKAARDPNPVGDPADREGLFGPAPTEPDDGALEDLHTFTVAFHHPRMDLDRDAGSQRRYFGLLRLSLATVHDLGHGRQGYHSAR